MVDAGDGPSDDLVLEGLWRRLTRGGRSEPLFTGEPDFPSRLRQLISDESGRALALVMLDHPEPRALSHVNSPEVQAQAYDAELDVLDALHAMGPAPPRRRARSGMAVRMRDGRRTPGRK
jgi:hypothetical protein